MENQKFIFPRKISNITLGMIGIGVLALVASYFMGVGAERIAANLLLNSYYFMALGLIGLFLVTVHTIAESGWHTSIQRVAEAMSSFIPVAGVLLLLLFALGGMHLLYHWTHADHLDEILLKKVAYLNTPFFFGRLLVYLMLWIGLAYFIRKNSLLLDQTGDLKFYRKFRTLSAVFVVVLAITSVTSSWDWLMSIDAHWFSTLYGWYVFSSMLASGTAVLILLVIALKRMGYMTHVNQEHIHDLGKYLFGFSIFWAYLWFSQYMLIWYANIPEETIYFYERHKHFSDVFYVNLILNFVVPFFALMTRNSKRGSLIMVPVALIVFIGHWVDLYQLIMPGVVGGENSGIGIAEIGITIGYAGLFLFVVFRSLAKAPLVPENHPFYKESLEYHTHY
ncbi:hypothetical protein [Sunxiuqinia sp. sy24]|uniref:hypothetical protein n=1 Tax=Sunxiuqinia sp. sy24 TaxID=3461495 RepID=UPI0040467E8F